MRTESKEGFFPALSERASHAHYMSRQPRVTRTSLAFDGASRQSPLKHAIEDNAKKEVITKLARASPLS